MLPPFHVVRFQPAGVLSDSKLLQALRLFHATVTSLNIFVNLTRNNLMFVDSLYVRYGSSMMTPSDFYYSPLQMFFLHDCSSVVLNVSV